MVTRRIVELFSKGARTLLDRWDWDSLAGQLIVDQAGPL